MVNSSSITQQPLLTLKNQPIQLKTNFQEINALAQGFEKERVEKALITISICLDGCCNLFISKTHCIYSSVINMAVGGALNANRVVYVQK
ncbi:hypothetical protein MANES_12G082216v8 [Manihot esculenta]|uniref:Uncharacterized protein n=1 Tax=Manihot esculenta TaxID=3983 RepID=A0ACB7GQ22_MANES|nr:hypothetical protein MANES_12G082216v8 [Manihot esculenta]